MTYPWESILSVLEGQRTLIKVDGKKQIIGTFAVMESLRGTVMTFKRPMF